MDDSVKKVLLTVFVLLISLMVLPFPASASFSDILASSGVVVHQKQIDILGQETVENLQVLLVVNTTQLIGQKMMSDCSDLWFVAEDKKTVLPHYLETGCNKEDTRIWVKIPNLTANKNATIYLKYRNPAASYSSNGEAVFEFFDDFNEETLDEGKWLFDDGNGDAQGRVSNGRFNLEISSPGTRPPTLSSKKTFKDGILETYVSLDAYSYGDPHFITYIRYLNEADIGVQTTARGGANDFYFFENGNVNGSVYFERPILFDEYFLRTSFSENEVSGYIQNIRTRNDSFTEVVVSHRNAGSVALGGWGAQTTSFDRVWIRKYAETEPIVSIGEMKVYVLGIPLFIFVGIGMAILAVSTIATFWVVIMPRVPLMLSSLRELNLVQQSATSTRGMNPVYLSMLGIIIVGVFLPWISINSFGIATNLSGWEMTASSDISKLGEEGIPVGKILFGTTLGLIGLYFFNRKISFAIVAIVNITIVVCMFYQIKKASEQIAKSFEVVNALGNLFGASVSAAPSITEFLGIGIYLCIIGLAISGILGARLFFVSPDYIRRSSQPASVSTAPSTSISNGVFTPTPQSRLEITPEIRRWVLDNLRRGYTPDQLKNLLSQSAKYDPAVIDIIIQETKP